MPITAENRAHAQDLLNFIDASPSPWHAVQSITQRLQAQGFVPLQEKLRWKLVQLNVPELNCFCDYAQARVSISSIAPVMRSPSLVSDATFSPN